MGWEGRGRAVLKIPLKYPGPGLTKITYHLLSSPSSSPCLLRNTCPVLGGSLRCGWSKTNALKTSADTELLTAIRVLSNGMLSTISYSRSSEHCIFGSDPHFDHTNKSEMAPWHVSNTENYQNCLPGLCPRSRWGSLQCSL